MQVTINFVSEYIQDSIIQKLGDHVHQEGRYVLLSEVN